MPKKYRDFCLRVIDHERLTPIVKLDQLMPTCGKELGGGMMSDADLRWTKTQDLVGQKVICVQVNTTRKNNGIFYWVNLGIWTTGCFQGTLEELKEKIEETHKDNDFLRERYYRVIDFILHEVEMDNDRI